MPLNWPEEYTPSGFERGWNGIKDTFWGNWDAIALTLFMITVAIIWTLAYAIGTRRKAKTAEWLGFALVGSLLCSWTWYQVYHEVQGGHLLIYLIILGITIAVSAAAAKARGLGDAGLVFGGLLYVVISFSIWYAPELWAWLKLW